MILAAVHLSAWVTVPIAVIVTGVIAIHWNRLGADGIPLSRLRIRRASAAVMFAALLLAVNGLSLADAETRPGEYVTTWLLIVFAVGLMLLAAGLDAVNTLRLGYLDRRARHLENLAALIDAVAVDVESPPEEGGDR